MDSKKEEVVISDVIVLGNHASTEDVWATHSANPMTWSFRRKVLIVFNLTLTNFVAAMTTMFAPGIDDMMRDLDGGSDTLKGFTMSVYVIGYCIGLLVIAPMSEIYGRRWPLQLAYPVALLSLVLCATSKNIAQFLVFRAVLGFAAISWVNLGPAVVADIFPKEKVGLYLSIISTGPSLGPTLGPVAGGFIIERYGWRWSIWTCAIAIAPCAIISFLVLKETYGPVLEAQYLTRPQRPQQPGLQSDISNISNRKSLYTLAQSPWLRPLRMLIRLPIISLFTLYTIICYSYLQIMFGFVGITFQDCYHFSDSAAGLTYLGMAIGFLISQFTVGRFAEAWSIEMARRRRRLRTVTDVDSDSNSGGNSASPPETKPEDQLPALILGALIMPVGLLLYGWGTRTHWIVPVIGSGVFAIGLMLTYLASQIYLVHAYKEFAASALAACSVIRNAVSALIPLAAPSLYRRLGYAWGNSLLALIAVAFVPFSILLMRWGERLRVASQRHCR